MKYGLPREEKPKKKWKAAIEDELKCLKMEVCILKNHLNDATNKLKELSSFKQTSSHNFMQCFPRNRNACSQTQPPHFIDFKPIFKANGNHGNLTTVFESSQENPFAPIERPHYHCTWDYDTVARRAVRIDSITCMPNYKDDKSFEELRYEDYILKGIGFSNQVKRFFQLRSSTTERNHLSSPSKSWKPKNSEGSAHQGFCIPWYLTPKPPKAPWPFGPSSKSSKISKSPASDQVECSESYSSNDSNLKAKQIKSEHLAFQRNITTQIESDMKTNITSDENISSQIFLELRKMTEKMSTVQDKLSKMDSNLSDVSSRVSVMDSRLSAVDIFVTMQRFDKKWQSLETRLAGLETPSPAKIPTQPVNESINNETTQPLTKVVTTREMITPIDKIDNASFDDETIDVPQPSKFGKSSISTPVTPVKNEAESPCTMDTSDLNLSDFVRSISCTDIAMRSNSLYSSQSADSAVLNSASKGKLEKASIEMADLKSFHSLPSEFDSMEDSGPIANEPTLGSSGSLSSVSVNIENCYEEKNGHGEKKTSSVVKQCDETTVATGENNQMGEPDLQINSFDKDNNNATISSDPLGVTEQQNSSLTKCGNLLIKETENDVDNDFVIVEKSDIEEALETTSNAITNEASSSEFKMYSDITEYLEINLGKKKNLVYEFGFEAKPDYLLESEGSPGHEKKGDKTQENKASTSNDDSFQQFITNFIENKCVDVKQSSPFVLHIPQSPENLPGKKPSDK